MTLILTNNRLALDMSDLEIQARKGDPLAQEMLEMQCRRAGRLHNAPHEIMKRAKKKARQQGDR